MTWDTLFSSDPLAPRPVERLASPSTGSRAARHAALAALLAAATLACAHPWPRYPAAPEPLVERVDRERLTIRWDGAPAAAPLRVYAGTAPDAIDRTTPIAEMSGPSVEFPDPDWRMRRYFELHAADGRRFLVAERRVPLEESHNFRDLGGYATEDGRRVRWGVLYRSDSLGSLSDDDLEAVANLPLRRVIDFRGPVEHDQGPDRLPDDPRPELVRIPVSSEYFSATAIEERIRSRQVADVDFEEMMRDGNRRFVTDFEHEFAHFLQLASNPEASPSVFHCTAGKDRTGFAAALVLLSLGVPRETVLRDYLLTNVYTANAVERTLFWIRAYLLFQTPEEQLRPLLTVRRDFLEAALDEIDERWGGFDRYVHEGLGVEDWQLEALREQLLEPAP